MKTPLFRFVMLINYGLLFATIFFFHNYRFPIQQLVGDVVGGPLIIVGAVLIILAHKELPKEHGQPEKINNLATKGIYSKIRHPVYFGFMLINFGLSLSFANCLMLILLFLFVSVWYMISKREEKFLIEKFVRVFEVYEGNTYVLYHTRMKTKKEKAQKPEMPF